MFQVTWIDTGETVTLTREEARSEFGRREFEEMRAGFLPLGVVSAAEDFGEDNSWDDFMRDIA
jgi:hypothetical protein